MVIYKSTNGKTITQNCLFNLHFSNKYCSI